MTSSCKTIVDRRDHVQYLTVSKSYSEYNIKDLYYDLVQMSAWVFKGGLHYKYLNLKYWPKQYK